MVRLGGQAIKEMVTYTVPKKLIELVYSCHGILLLDDLEFNIIIRDTGLIYEFFTL